MSASSILRKGVRALIASTILTCLFAAGVWMGLWFYPQVFPVTAEQHDDHHDEHDGEDHGHDDHGHEEEGNLVALTQQAFDNLQLRLAHPKKGDYWKSILLPGKVVEIPGRSDLAVSTPVTGVIESVKVLPGESIPMESPLFEIRLTDEALLTAQANYLETLTRQEVAQQEIERLTPLIASGAVSGAKKRELEYEVKQLLAKQATSLQELRGRGMPEAQIEELKRERTLASTLAVFAPKFVHETQGTQETPNGYSIENLLVHPGKAVTRGESLCTVAYHQKLYVEGTAFEIDLPILKRIAQEGWLIDTETSVDFHLHSSSHSSATPMQLELLRVDNHVDEATQTVRFFLELPNEVTQTLTEDGHQFEQWKYRPGQRFHLRLPVERWENQITLPADAVVIDGPNAIVFVEHHHEEDHEVAEQEADHDHHHLDEDAHHDHNVFIELESIPVQLLHRDDKTVVIADDGQIHDEFVALNNAYKLYLAMKMQAGGGGGHHHDH